MHLVSPQAVALSSSDADSITLAGERGERFQITLLDHSLVRVQHWPDGAPRLDRTWCVAGPPGDVPLEGRSRADLSPFRRPGLRLENTPGGLRLHSDALALDARLGDLRLEWQLPSGEVFAADVPAHAYTYDRAGRAVFHHLARRDGEHYYGFGEKAGPLDKAGMRLRMCNADAFGYDAERTDPLYKHIPFYITYVAELGLAYGLFYDNLSATTFDLGREVNALRGGRYRVYEAADGDLDYYLMLGPTVEAVVEQYTALTGRPALPPRWS
ncbi:MAG: alpha-glucosidase, partial [Chloroflexota bacterium]